MCYKNTLAFRLSDEQHHAITLKHYPCTHASLSVESFLYRICYGHAIGAPSFMSMESAFSIILPQLDQSVVMFGVQLAGWARYNIIEYCCKIGQKTR